MGAVLVRRRDIESDSPPAGEFRTADVGRGLIPASVLAPLGLYCVDTTDRVFSLTYDDGPDPESTPAILDMLAHHGARATFFVLARPAKRHPEIVRRIVDEGHELALHGLDHRSLLTIPVRDGLANIRESRRIVEDIAQRRVALFRPPYGSHTMRQSLAIHRLGLDIVIWSGYASDWVDDDEHAVVERAVAGVFPGGILLMHDTRADPETLLPGERLPAFDRAAVLDKLLRTTRSDGYTELPVGELVERYPAVKSLSRERMAIP